ncbi:cytochrome P450, partial [Nocardia sp. NPDC003345]
MEKHTAPVVLDPSGSDIQGESARLRERGPVAAVELPGGVRAWSVTDAALLEDLLAGPEVSKNATRHWPAFRDGAIGADWPLTPWVAPQNMFTAYGDDHRRLRRIVAPAFTHRRTTALEPRIAEITGALLDDLAAIPPGTPVDLRERFAYPLPIQVICELMGVPEELHARLRKCVDGVFDTSLSPEQSQANYTNLYALMYELVAYRRAHPGDDMTSLLVAATDDPGTPLSEQELVDTLML